MKTKVYFIHGANASHLSGKYIEICLNKFNISVTYLTYDMGIPIEQTIDILSKRINENCVVIGHSLGGLIALGLAQKNEYIKHVFTLASPINGLSYLIKFIVGFGDQAMKDIIIGSSFIDNLKKNPPICNVTCFVTTKGNTIIKEPNDGVISVASQYIKHWFYIEIDPAKYTYIITNTNHFEILLDTSTIQQISRKIYYDFD